MNHSRRRFSRGARRVLARALLGLLLLLGSAGGLAAQSERQIEVRVTFLTSDSIYLDKGSEAGLRQGDRVRFLIPGYGAIEAPLVMVTRSSCRADISGGDPLPSQGSLGVVELPASRLGGEEGITGTGAREESVVPAPPPEPPPAPPPVPSPAPPPAPEMPEHPPWEREMQPAAEDTPLLAPAFGRKPSERAMRVHGRIYSHFLSTWDRGDDRDNSSSLARLGADARIQNPFRRGGRLHVDAEISQRAIDLGDGLDETEERYRLDRISYRWGGGRDDRFGVKLGRMLPTATPEIGLLDGVELLMKTRSAGRLGLSVGALPEPLPDRQSGDDIGTTLSYRYSRGDREELALAVAYHQSWHQGESDRNLIIGRADYLPDRRVSIHSTVWVDYYGGDDRIKSQGFELTQAQIHGSFRYRDGHGVRASLSQLRWPELLRKEFAVLPDAVVDDNRVTRASFSSWNRLSDHVRLEARLDHWSDQDESDTGGELTARFPGLWKQGNEIAVGIFRAAGAFGNGPGARLAMRQSFSKAFLELSYELRSHEIDTFGGGSETLLEQAFRANLDLYTFRSWTLSLNGDYRFGDGQDALSSGILLQYRF